MHGSQHVGMAVAEARHGRAARWHRCIPCRRHRECGCRCRLRPRGRRAQSSDAARGSCEPPPRTHFASGAAEHRPPVGHQRSTDKIVACWRLGKTSRGAVSARFVSGDLAATRICQIACTDERHNQRVWNLRPEGAFGSRWASGLASGTFQQHGRAASEEVAMTRQLSVQRTTIEGQPGARKPAARHAPPVARACGAAQRRGHDRPGHGRRKPHQMAPRTRHLVLRDLHPRQAPAAATAPSTTPSTTASTPTTRAKGRGSRAPSAAC